MSDDVVISVENVSKNFVLPHEKVSTVKGLFTSLHKKRNKTTETQHALRNINFEVKEGEFFGIVGRNGSGKSTLLKILASIYQPSQGRIQRSGRLVPFIELGVGFNPELTGRENVYLNGALLGFSRKQIDSMYDEIVAFAEMEKFMDQKLKNYSSGMQVRLAFSVATRADADILLIDEVLAVGDADFQRKCFNHFRELKKQKKTVVFVSHDMSAIREYCDRAIMIEKSKIVASGTANDVAVEYIKLFNNQTGSRNDADDKTHWGDKDVKLTSVEAKVTKETITLEAKVKVTKTSEDPVFGYLIKDSAGNELLGSNSKIKNFKVGTLTKGEQYDLSWEIPNVFNDGIFSATVAISHNDGVTQHDWWEDAATFTVFREDKTPYALNPEAHIKLKKLK